MTDLTPESESSSEKSIGRNEPCPCGSGKKYKRCCGVAAAPKLSVPKVPAGFPGMGAGAGGDAGANPFGGMDPQFMMQMGQALQRLPKGQIQKLQAIMQKAMSGKDVTQEAADFEKTLPLEFQTMLRGFQMPGMPGAAGAGGAAEAATNPGLLGDMSAMGDMGALFGSSPGAAASEPSAADLSVEEARRIVEEAAKSGKISAEQAQTLLEPQELKEPKEEAETSEKKGIGGFFKGLKSKK